MRAGVLEQAELLASVARSIAEHLDVEVLSLHVHTYADGEVGVDVHVATPGQVDDVAAVWSLGVDDGASSNYSREATVNTGTTRHHLTAFTGRPVLEAAPSAVTA